MRQPSRGWCSSILTGCTLQLAVLSGCGDSPASDRHDAAEPPPAAETLAGLIVRDGETSSEIAATATVELPSHDPETSPLSVVVTKSRYRLDVVLQGDRIKTFPIALGRSPSGAKQVQGDSRTPEGAYVLFPHHASPTFGGSFYVAYPNAEDARLGFERGSIDAPTRDRILGELRRGHQPPHRTRLGGLILIHGTRQRSIPWLTKRNWTDGCIAMENDHLLELLAAFRKGDRPVLRIRP